MEPINLHELAVQAMLARGLLPAFSPEALQQAEAASRAGPNRGDENIRDLRQLTWFSIDNDDTLDLDQLSVAEAQPGGACRGRGALADADGPGPNATPVDVL